MDTRSQPEAMLIEKSVEIAELITSRIKAAVEDYHRSPEYQQRKAEADEFGRAIRELKNLFQTNYFFSESGVRRLESLGWFVDIGMLAPFQSENVTDKNFPMVLRYVEGYYRQHAGTMVNRLCMLHPKRREILLAAYAAHQRQEYLLSVPVFIAQADGLTKDLLDCSLFMARDFKKRTLLISELEKDVPFTPFLGQLKRKLTSSRSTSEGHSPYSFNRHLVLHGLDLTYGTEVNSLKALSMLYYVSWVLEVAKGFQSLKRPRSVSVAEQK